MTHFRFKPDVSTPRGYALYRRQAIRNRQEAFYESENRVDSFVDTDFFNASISPASDKDHPVVADQDTSRDSNPDTNVLRRLPPELILMVAERLQPEDFMNLRATYKWHCDLVEPIEFDVLRGSVFDPNPPPRKSQAPRPPRSLAIEPIDDPAVRLHIDRFALFAKQEIARRSLDGAPGDKLLCSYCLDDHPLLSFTAADRAKLPTERVCIGAQAVLPICPHKGSTFKQLGALHCPSPGAKSGSTVYEPCEASCRVSVKTFDFEPLYSFIRSTPDLGIKDSRANTLVRYDIWRGEDFTRFGPTLDPFGGG